MKDKIFIDSNILVYLASEQDREKKYIVTELVDKNFGNRSRYLND